MFIANKNLMHTLSYAELEYGNENHVHESVELEKDSILIEF